MPPIIGIPFCPFANGERESRVVSTTKKTTKNIKPWRKRGLIRLVDRGNFSVIGSCLTVPGIRKNRPVVGLAGNTLVKVVNCCVVRVGMGSWSVVVSVVVVIVIKDGANGKAFDVSSVITGTSLLRNDGRGRNCDIHTSSLKLTDIHSLEVYLNRLISVNFLWQ